MKFDRLVNKTKRGLGYAAAGALCVPLGAFQCFAIGEATDISIKAREWLLRESHDQADRYRLVKELKYLYESDMPTLSDCISGMYKFMRPYPRV